MTLVVKSLKCRIDTVVLDLDRGTGIMCHMFLLNVEFGNSFGFPVSLFDRLAFSIPAFSVTLVLTRTNGVLEVARIFTKYSKCCDKFFVLTMSLYAFISLLYKQLLQYTLLKSFTVPSALLTKFNIIYRFLKIVHENTLTL